MREQEDARKGKNEHSFTVYIPDQEWELLVRKLQEQGQEGTRQQVLLFAKQWAKAGMRMPIREELEKVLFKLPSNASPS